MNALSHRTAVSASIILFGVSALVGWQLGGRPGSAATDPAMSAPSEKLRANRPVRPRPGPSDEARAALAAIRSETTPEARMRATIALAQTLPTAELAAWLKGGWFNLRDGVYLTYFTKIAAERLYVEDPAAYLAWCENDPSGRSMGQIGTLAKRDPQAVLSYFRDHPNDQLQMQALAGLAVDNPELAIEALKAMLSRGISSKSQGAESFLFGSLAESHPDKLEELIGSLPPQMKNNAESALWGKKLKTSFKEELLNLFNRPDGLALLSRVQYQIEDFPDKILGELSGLPSSWKAAIASGQLNLVRADSAEKWLTSDLENLGFTSGQAKALQTQSLMNLISRDPEKVIGYLKDLNLEPSQRSSILMNMMLRIEGDKRDTILASLSPEDRKTAEQVGARPQIIQSHVQEMPTPAIWMEKVTSSTAIPESELYTFSSSLSTWNRNQMEDLAASFKTMSGENKDKVAAILAQAQNYSNVPRELSADAVSYMLSQPAKEPTAENGNRQDPAIQMASQLAVNWSASDPEAASTWVASLPEGKARTWALRNLVENWAEYDTKAADQWINALPAAEQKDLRDFLKSTIGKP